MTDHRRSHSWGPFSSRVESADVKPLESSEGCRTPKRRHCSKPPALLRKLMPVGNHASLKMKRKAVVRHRHPRTPPERSRCSSDSEDGSSFVASRSNLLLNSGPVVCPPIPPEHTIPEDASSCGSVRSWSTRSLSYDLEVSSVESNHKSLGHERRGKIQNKDSGEFDGAGHFRRHTYDVFHRQERIVPSLETVVDAMEPSQMPVVGYTVEQKIGSFVMETSSEKSIRSQSQRDRSRSSLLGGKLQFCPEEGILILEQYHPLQTPSSHAKDHKRMRMEFKNSSKKGRKFRKKALFWGLRYKRRPSVLSKATSFLQRSTSRDRTSFKWSLLPKFLRTDKKACAPDPHSVSKSISTKE